MELIFSRKDMREAMEIVGRAVAKSNILPVLSNVLICALRDPLSEAHSNPKDEGNSIYVAATDLEMGIRTRIPGQVVEKGGITLPAKTFASVISALSEEEVKLIASKDRARICCENGEFRIIGLPADQFPSLIAGLNRDAQLELTEGTKEKKGVDFLNLDSGALGLMLGKTSFAAGRDENRYFLNGVHLSLKNGEEKGGMLMKMAATDGIRLAMASTIVIEEPLEKEIGAIIPNRAVKELEKLSTRSDAVKISSQENRIIFDMGDTALVSALLEGEYPDYEQVIPVESKINLKANTERLLSAARRMAQVADPKLPCVKLEAKETRLKASASSVNVGEGSEEMDVDHQGDDIQVAINVRYLMDALKAIDSQETLIGIDSASQPIVIKPSVGDYLCVLMPMRV